MKAADVLTRINSCRVEPLGGSAIFICQVASNRDLRIL